MIGVYGSNGFIGRHLAETLAREGRSVRAISRHKDNYLSKLSAYNIELVEADLMDSLAMASSLNGIDTVVQLISTSSPGFGNRHLISDVKQNVIPHIEFISQCIEAGVKRYIFISSGGAVYGPTRHCPIGEDHPTNPISSHGLTKLTTEKYLQMLADASGLEYIILRLANAYGPGQVFRKGQGLIPAVLERHSRGDIIQIIGDGQARRDYIYIDDIVRACICAIDANTHQRHIINIGSGESKSIIEVLDEMEKILGTKFQRGFIEARQTDVNISQLDITKAKEILGWSPAVGFSDGLKRMLNFNCHQDDES